MASQKLRTLNYLRMFAGAFIGAALLGTPNLVTEGNGQAAHFSTVESLVPEKNGHLTSHSAVIGYGKVPLSFERNRGQTDAQVKFVSRGPGYSLFLMGSKLVVSLKKVRTASAQERGAHNRVKPHSPERTGGQEEWSESALQLEFAWGNTHSEIVGEDELPVKSNYFIGNDPSTWRTNVPNYAKVRYRDIYPGIDLIYYGNHGELEYDFVVSPGADPNAIELLANPLHGRRLSVRLSSKGDLLVGTHDNEVQFRRPVVYQRDGRGKNKYIQADYVLAGRRLRRGGRGVPIRFRLAPYDHTRPLVIDPTLGYSTYLGGTRQDFANAIAVDGFGNAYVTGQTLSIDFPLKKAYQSSCTNCNLTKPDIFITKLTPDGSALVYSTYLGGSNSSTQTGMGIAVDSSGNAYVTGYTQAADFPTTPGTYRTCLACPITQNSPFGQTDAFVTKLDPAGSLVYSTYLGGSAGSYGDGGNAIAVDASGSAYVTGMTSSLDFPTTANAFQPTCDHCDQNGGVAFVTKLSPNGQIPLAYSTYLGGTGASFTGGDQGNGIGVDSAGSAYVTGTASLPNFPTTPGAFQTQYHINEGPAVFVAKLKPDGSGPLVYSTLIGGTAFDNGYAIAVDSHGNVYVTGQADSADFPTTPQAFQTTHPNPADADSVFVTKLNQTGSALVYSTFLDGVSPATTEVGQAIAVDSQGNAYLTGRTGAPSFPTTPDALRTSCAGCADKVFVSVLNPTGQALVYSTYLGGTGIDLGNGLALDRAGNVYVTGNTFSSNFPVTQGAFQTTCAGGCVLNDIDHPETDAFITKFIFKKTGTRTNGDFDGDGKADYGVWRRSAGTWFVIPSSTPGNFLVQQWGASGDLVVHGDYDGDGKTDVAVFRPSSGTWFVIPSSNPGTPIIKQWGGQGDIPVPGDYDGDGKTDFAVYRPSTGTWFIIPSSNPGAPIIQQWGTQGDVPVPGDYDGDGKTDFAIFRPSNGTWYIIPSSNPGAPIFQQWGASDDLPVQADYDGDGKTDFAVFRPSNGTWFIIPTGSPNSPIVQQWGTLGDVPVPADYDGDQIADIAVWRPSNGTWYVIPSSAPATSTVTQWGASGDVPVQKPIGQ